MCICVSTMGIKLTNIYISIGHRYMQYIDYATEIYMFLYYYYMLQDI